MFVFCRLIVTLWLTAWVAHAGLPRLEEQTPPHSSALSRARVVVVEDPRAVIAFNPAAGVVESMVNAGLMTWTSQNTPDAGWRSLVSTQDIVGIKVFSSPGATSGTRRVVVEAVVKGL